MCADHDDTSPLALRERPRSDSISSDKFKVLFSNDGSAWRLSARGNIAVYLAQELDEHGDAFPVPEPNLLDLAKFMWALDAPYAVTRATPGEITIDACGSSVAALSGWLYEYLTSAKG